MLLSSWFFGLLFASAASALVAWFAVELRRRRRMRAHAPVMSGWHVAVARAGALLVVLSLTVATTADGVNRHFAYIPSFEALMGNVSPDVGRTALGPGRVVARAPSHGTIVSAVLGDPALRVPHRTLYVYLPPAYLDPTRPGQRFPVLYLLHGSPGISIDWIRAGYADRAMDALLHAHRTTPFLIVFPDFNLGYTRDTECEDIVGGAQMQTFLVRDVVGYVDEHFRTEPGRLARAIGGLSTGGYCAINLAFRHPDVFSAAVSHSGYFEPDLNVYSGNLFGGSMRLRLANTPAYYLPWIPITQPTGVYLDCGSEDAGSLRDTLAMASILRRRGVFMTERTIAGLGHTWVTWRRVLYFSLPWVSSWFARWGVAVSNTSPIPTQSFGHHEIA